MGACSEDNTDYTGVLAKPTACPSGYDMYYNSCCNHSMYIFWNVMLWVALCSCCMLCIVLMA